MAQQTIYASFPDAGLAEKAAGALLDYGVKQEDLSLVSNGERGQGQVTSGSAWDSTAAAQTEPAYANTGTLANPGAYGTTGAVGSGASYAGDRAADDASSVGHRVAQAGDRTAGYVTGAVGADNTSSNYHIAADQHDMNAQAHANMAGNEDVVHGTSDRTVYTTGATNRSDRDEMDADDRTVDTTHDQSHHLDNIAKHGITTTTAADAGSGAVKGAGIGLVLGAIAAFAVPGVGWAIGGGALASALGATALAAGAGAIAGGVTGYLKDQGVPSHVAEKYHSNIQQGGALLALHLPSGKVDQAMAHEVLAKYGGSDVNTY